MASDEQLMDGQRLSLLTDHSRSYWTVQHQLIIEGEGSERCASEGRTVPGPLLFLIFNNDLPGCITSRTR